MPVQDLPPELPGWNVAVTDQLPYGGHLTHVQFTATTLLRKTDLDKLGPDFVERTIAALREAFDEVLPAPEPVRTPFTEALEGMRG